MTSSTKKEDLKKLENKKDEFLDGLSISSSLYNTVFDEIQNTPIQQLNIPMSMQSWGDGTIGLFGTEQQSAIVAFYVLFKIFGEADNMLQGNANSVLYFTTDEEKILQLHPKNNIEISDLLLSDDNKIEFLKSNPNAFIFHQIITLHYGSPLSVDLYEKIGDFSNLLKMYHASDLNNDDKEDENFSDKIKFFSVSIEKKLHYIKNALDIPNAINDYPDLSTQLDSCNEDIKKLKSLNIRGDIKYLEEMLIFVQKKLGKVEKQPSQQQIPQQQIPQQQQSQQQQSQQSQQQSSQQKEETKIGVTQALSDSVERYINNSPIKLEQNQRFGFLFKEIEVLDLGGNLVTVNA
jgi:hypothetical protein